MAKRRANRPRSRRHLSHPVRKYLVYPVRTRYISRKPVHGRPAPMCIETLQTAGIKDNGAVFLTQAPRCVIDEPYKKFVVHPDENPLV